MPSAPTGGPSPAVRQRQEGPPPDSAEAVGPLGSVAGELDRLDVDLRRARRPALLTVPEPLRRGRLSVSSAAVVALLALVVALGCVFALRVLWAERASEPGAALGASSSPVGVVVSHPSPSTTQPGEVMASGSRPAGGTPAHAPATVATELVVHVVGQVLRPGLVRLRQGSRVADAIAAAGGARTGADLTALNLARPVVDGEQVHVPKPGEVVSGRLSAPSSTVGAGGAGTGTGTGAGTGTTALVDLNTADAAALDTLPGVGPVLAQRILDWRTEHGRFSSVDELGEVSGIGDKLMSQLRPRVRV
ncbi:MAG: ComEA family DNA-binding protein [Terracoccus sp.]